MNWYVVKEWKFNDNAIFVISKNKQKICEQQYLKLCSIYNLLMLIICASTCDDV